MHTKSPGETLARLLGLFPPVIRDSMAWAVLSLLQFILVQVLVRTNDGGRKPSGNISSLTMSFATIFPECRMQSGGITLMP
uniref:Plasmid transfer ATPase TraJ n=1 Tax=Escherichia coli TaxID=562 RepID=A0A3G4RTH6_ECOLX|nr:plasmid transfer ATPase TraJ [Escherichia coli]